MKKIITLLLTMAAFALPYMNVYADDTETLAVDIASYDGSTLLCAGDGPLYTSLPVSFKPDGSKGRCAYSISIDDGESLGSYVEADSVTLYPDDDTVYTLRFHYGEEYAFREVTFRPRQGVTNSINIKKIVKIGWKALGDFRRLKKAM